ncbi:hypothetical protein PspLS_09124 [Pyricularia sp. CBS 133598]|nr:hypothetical protein PspLS_09124 [Pyricularia sp. CBS 133598]
MASQQGIEAPSEATQPRSEQSINLTDLPAVRQLQTNNNQVRRITNNNGLVKLLD